MAVSSLSFGQNSSMNSANSLKAGRTLSSITAATSSRSSAEAPVFFQFSSSKFPYGFLSAESIASIWDGMFARTTRDWVMFCSRPSSSRSQCCLMYLGMASRRFLKFFRSLTSSNLFFSKTCGRSICGADKVHICTRYVFDSTMRMFDLSVSTRTRKVVLPLRFQPSKRPASSSGKVSSSLFKKASHWSRHDSYASTDTSSSLSSSS
mmetsp:Transcript_7260/g.10811  ORF Transcript_7260/g.10811 Transcript_7260/m.10811 type:complete len:207 (-) Transcript_7260:263-883(-)